MNTDGERADLVGNWSAVLMSVGGGVGPTSKDDEDGVKIFALPELATDWGSRWISDKSPLYDPVSYNNGTAWPFATGLVAWAQYAHGQPLAGYQSLMSVAHLTGAQAPGAVPEHMSGSRNEPGARSVPHQLFSSWALIRPLVAGMLGFHHSTDEHAAAPFVFSPAIPPQWSGIGFRNFRFATSTISAVIRQSPGRVEVQEGGKNSTTVLITERLPFGVSEPRIERGPPTENAPRIITYKGGIGIKPIDPKPQRGETNTSLKILSGTPDDKGRTLTLELAGLANRSYDLDLITTEPRLSADGAQVEKTPNGYRLHVPFGPGDDYVTKTITVKY